MQRINLQKLRDMAYDAAGSIDKIYIHWTAGKYHQCFEDYHINIDNDGAIIISSELLTVRKSHTWMRNSRAIGIALCCGFGARANNGNINYGDWPPTAIQIESAAVVLAVLCEELHLPISRTCVMTHCEAAEIDGYGPSTSCERWDLWKLVDTADGKTKGGGEILRGKAIWYQQRRYNHCFEIIR